MVVKGEESLQLQTTIPRVGSRKVTVIGSSVESAQLLGTVTIRLFKAPMVTSALMVRIVAGSCSSAFLQWVSSNFIQPFCA